MQIDIETLRAERANLTIVSNEWQKLTDEELLVLMNDITKLDLEISRYEYTKQSFDERVSWWSNQTRLHMRMQAESGLDQLSLFDKKWYGYALQKEPKILEILPVICAHFGIPFPIIQRLLVHEVTSEEWRSVRMEAPGTDYV